MTEMAHPTAGLVRLVAPAVRYSEGELDLLFMRSEHCANFSREQRATTTTDTWATHTRDSANALAAERRRTNTTSRERRYWVVNKRM